LNASRPAFGDHSEREILADCIDRRLARGSIRWLEVGVGDGKNLAFLLTRLRDGRSFEVTAIDPAPAVAKMALDGAGIRLLHTGVESFQSEDRYDCINVRQSCYYFDDPAARLTQLGDLLTASGALVLTVWTERCALHRLHGQIARSSGRGGQTVHSDILASAMIRSGFRIEQRRLSAAPLSIGVIQASDAVAGAVYRLAARSLDIYHSEADQAEKCRSFLAGREGDMRENEIMILSR